MIPWHLHEFWRKMKEVFWHLHVTFYIDRPFSQYMSPRNAVKNKEIRQETMLKLMDAAFLLIARQGYESTSIAQIAREAGVSKGLLYNYFLSKEDLLEKLIQHAMAQGDQIMATRIHRRSGDHPGKHF